MAVENPRMRTPRAGLGASCPGTGRRRALPPRALVLRRSRLRRLHDCPGADGALVRCVRCRGPRCCAEAPRSSPPRRRYVPRNGRGGGRFPRVVDASGQDRRRVGRHRKPGVRDARFLNRRDLRQRDGGRRPFLRSCARDVGRAALVRLGSGGRGSGSRASRRTRAPTSSSTCGGRKPRGHERSQDSCPTQGQQGQPAIRRSGERSTSRSTTRS